jgi:DNA replicative helicase MCM subunit Mcm2 (Cdc46/Mcm family)
MYARDRVYPKINNIDHEKIEKLYSELRRESMVSYFDDKKQDWWKHSYHRAIS